MTLEISLCCMCILIRWNEPGHLREKACRAWGEETEILRKTGNRLPAFAVSGLSLLNKGLDLCSAEGTNNFWCSAWGGKVGWITGANRLKHKQRQGPRFSKGCRRDCVKFVATQEASENCWTQNKTGEMGTTFKDVAGREEIYFLTFFFLV